MHRTVGLDWAQDTLRVATLQSGESDMVEEVAAALVVQIENDPQFQMIYRDTLGCPRTIMLNNEKFPTDDLAVRQAMAYAVNKKTLTDSVFKKTVKVDMDKIAKLKFVPSENKKQVSHEFEVTLRDGVKHTLTMLTTTILAPVGSC